METIMMSERQYKKAMKQSRVLREYVERKRSRKEAAEALGLSERQITRKAAALKSGGEGTLIHGNTGRAPHNTIGGARQAKILEIRGEGVYAGCNISHFKDILKDDHGIAISYGALYELLKANGIKSPKSHRKGGGAQHRPRKRRQSEGELQQIDATPYEWFALSGDNEKYALHGSIDDATGKANGLYISENECLNGYFNVARQGILNFGVPMSVYSDKHTIFRSPKTDRAEEVGGEASLTQFGRALDELGVDIIHANTPQAKGRVERMWQTLQSRLPVEFAKRGISDVEAANRFLETEYIPMFNARFSVDAEGAPVLVKYSGAAPIDTILCVKETRTTDAAGCFSYKGQYFRILGGGRPLIPARKKIGVLVSPQGGVMASYHGQTYKAEPSERPTTASRPSGSRKKKLSPEHAAQAERLVHSTPEWKAVWWAEPYNDTLNFIYDLFLKDTGVSAYANKRKGPFPPC
jgi:transposase